MGRWPEGRTFGRQQEALHLRGEIERGVGLDKMVDQAYGKAPRGRPDLFIAIGVDDSQRHWEGADESLTSMSTPLAHHFDDAEQQFDAASLGMWIFLGTEVMFFGGMFMGYTAYRLEYPRRSSPKAAR